MAGIGISTGPTARHAVEGTVHGGRAADTVRRRCEGVVDVRAWKLPSRWFNIDISFVRYFRRDSSIFALIGECQLIDRK